MGAERMLIDVPRTPRNRKADIAEFKRANHIWTYSSGPAFEHCGKWTALLLPGNPHSELPYGEDMDPKEPMEIIAGYCRVLEEAGFLVDGPTEREAIRALCGNLQIPCTL